MKRSRFEVSVLRRPISPLVVSNLLSYLNPSISLSTLLIAAINLHFYYQLKKKTKSWGPIWCFTFVVLRLGRRRRQSRRPVWRFTFMFIIFKDQEPLSRRASSNTISNQLRHLRRSCTGNHPCWRWSESFSNSSNSSRDGSRKCRFWL